MTKAGKTSGWKDDFLFVGNQLALDFVNTRPLQNGEKAELLGDFGALLRWFQAAGLLRPGEARRLQRQWGGTVRATKTTEAMRALREKLRTDILSWEHGGAIRRSTVDDLNRLMADHPMRARLTRNKNAHSTELWFESRAPEDLFAPVTHGAVGLFTSLDRNRVRKCARCILHFRDTSKKGTRRWCSMQLCGNRLKVAAYLARRRKRTRNQV